MTQAVASRNADLNGPRREVIVVAFSLYHHDTNKPRSLPIDRVRRKLSTLSLCNYRFDRSKSEDEEGRSKSKLGTKLTVESAFSSRESFFFWILAEVSRWSHRGMQTVIFLI